MSVTPNIAPTTRSVTRLPPFNYNKVDGFASLSHWLEIDENSARFDQ